MTLGLPPLQAKIGLFSEPSSSTSCVRPLRIGPTGSGPLALEHRGEAGEVLDVLLEDDVGLVQAALRASSGWLSIFTTSAGRAASAGSSIGTPVSGITGIGRNGRRRAVDRRVGLVEALVVVLVVGRRSVVGTVLSAPVVVGAELPEPPHAARASAAIINIEMRLGGFHGSLSDADALCRAGGGVDHGVKLPSNSAPPRPTRPPDRNVHHQL